ncbi:156R [Invertebrate iridescent virus 6]|uniref:Uncharacterized protein 156R n=1 Tax=Invertebrate iridescent virus 6 TaxID=176652 RepID=156R_IIV6|nr:156R [Invertebrate iridescent virus 6]O55755.1 RecName: Full=Uncharacterized protein 156R [Invertebrate iridescent virus 6]AAB94466.1 156R [Invertebrate iridescent virus 6]
MNFLQNFCRSKFIVFERVTPFTHKIIHKHSHHQTSSFNPMPSEVSLHTSHNFPHTTF